LLTGPAVCANKQEKELPDMKFALLAAAVATMSAGFLALPAMADDDDLSPARLERLDQRAQERGLKVSRQDAVAIALQNGMTSVREIDLDDDNDWDLEGSQANGREIEIEISGVDGRVKELDRD
jgi:uncharacterized membrane protein YkoI